MFYLHLSFFFFHFCMGDGEKTILQWQDNYMNLYRCSKVKDTESSWLWLSVSQLPLTKHV